jgi:ABC-2 type transport system permease protein
MSTVKLILRQIRYTNKAFWRNPASAFFTFAFPLMFLVIFTTLLGNGHVPGLGVKQSTLYVPAMAAFGVITACYTNLAINISIQRDEGILKRLRGTPLPAWAFMIARVLHAMLVALILVVICTGFGVLVYGAHLPSGTWLLRYAVTFIVGGAAFAALGLALTGAIPNADASPAIVNASILPLLFLSDVFIQFGTKAPAWVNFVGKVFPVRHFVEAMKSAYLERPSIPTFAFKWTDLAVVAIWGVGGVIVASRTMSWEPRK